MTCDNFLVQPIPTLGARTSRVYSTTDVKAGRTPNFYATSPWSLSSCHTNSTLTYTVAQRDETITALKDQLEKIQTDENKNDSAEQNPADKDHDDGKPSNRGGSTNGNPSNEDGKSGDKSPNGQSGIAQNARESTVSYQVPFVVCLFVLFSVLSAVYRMLVSQRCRIKSRFLFICLSVCSLFDCFLWFFLVSACDRLSFLCRLFCVVLV